MKKKIYLIAFLCLIILLFVGCTLQNIGQAARVRSLDDELVIQSDELKECCSYTDGLGKENKCTILKQYDCSYCDSYCRK